MKAHVSVGKRGHFTVAFLGEQKVSAEDMRGLAEKLRERRGVKRASVRREVVNGVAMPVVCGRINTGVRKLRNAIYRTARRYCRSLFGPQQAHIRPQKGHQCPPPRLQKQRFHRPPLALSH